MHQAECFMCIISLIPYNSLISPIVQVRKLRLRAFESLVQGPTIPSVHADCRHMTATSHGFSTYMSLPACLLVLDGGLWEMRGRVPPEESTGSVQVLILPPKLFLGPQETHVVRGAVSSSFSSRFRPQSSGLDSHPISRDSGQSATTFKTSATFEELSASEAKLQSCSIFMLLNCHSPDKTQSTLKQFASQNFPSLPHSVQAHRSFEVFL